MDDYEDALNNFVSITGTAPEVAGPYLRLVDNNLEEAVNLFFANDGVPLPQTEQQPAPSRPSQSSRTTGYEDASGVVHLDSDDDISDDNDPAMTGYNPRAANHNLADASVEDDAAMARRLQEEMYGGGGGGAEEDIRAPMARTTETLVGPNFGGDYEADDMHAAVLRQVQERSRARANGKESSLQDEVLY